MFTSYKAPLVLMKQTCNVVIRNFAKFYWKWIGGYTFRFGKSNAL